MKAMTERERVNTEASRLNVGNTEASRLNVGNAERSSANVKAIKFNTIM